MTPPADSTSLVLLFAQFSENTSHWIPKIASAAGHVPCWTTAEQGPRVAVISRDPRRRPQVKSLTLAFDSTVPNVTRGREENRVPVDVGGKDGTSNFCSIIVSCPRTACVGNEFFQLCFCRNMPLATQNDMSGIVFWFKDKFIIGGVILCEITICTKGIIIPGIGCVLIRCYFSPGIVVPSLFRGGGTEVAGSPKNTRR